MSRKWSPLYIPTDLRKLIWSFAAPIHAYFACAIDDQNYIRVLGVFRTLIQAVQICWDNQRISIFLMKEGDVLPDKIYSRLLYPPQRLCLSSILFHPTLQSSAFNKICSFCMEKIEINTLVVRLPCNHVFHPRGIQTWMENALHCPLCRKNIRNGLPSPLNVGEIVYIDEGHPYVLGEGGPRKFVLSLSKTSRKNINFYNTIESAWKVKLHPKGGGVTHPYKFYVQ